MRRAGSGEGGLKASLGWEGKVLSHHPIICCVIAAAGHCSRRRPSSGSPLESTPGHEAKFLLELSWGGAELVLSKKEDPPSIHDSAFKAVRRQAGAQMGLAVASGFQPSLESKARSHPLSNSAATDSTNTSCAPTMCQTRTLDPHHEH